MKPLDVLINHIFATLPDSIASRKTLLVAVQALMKHKHPAYFKVVEMLSNMQRNEELRAELQLAFEDLLAKSKSQKPPTHNGHHNGK